MMATLHPQTMLQQMDVAQLLALVRDEAQCHHDGHFTVLAFTTEFKVAFDTPSALEFGTVGYIQVQTMPGFPTLKGVDPRLAEREDRRLLEG